MPDAEETLEAEEGLSRLVTAVAALFAELDAGRAGEADVLGVAAAVLLSCSLLLAIRRYLCSSARKKERGEKETYIYRERVCVREIEKEREPSIPVPQCHIQRRSLHEHLPTVQQLTILVQPDSFYRRGAQ